MCAVLLRWPLNATSSERGVTGDALSIMSKDRKVKEYDEHYGAYLNI